MMSNSNTYIMIRLKKRKEELFDETALMNATQKNYVEKVDLIIHHPSNDKNRSSYQEAFYISIKNKSFGIFKKFLSLLDDINKYEYEDISILPLATKYTNLKSFNPNKTDFLNAFKDKFCFTNDSYEI